MLKQILTSILLVSSLYSAQMPKMGFEKSFYVENTCESFKYDKENKDFNPKNCFTRNKVIFALDHCIIVDNGILCISSENRENYFLKANFITAEDMLVIKERIIEVTKIVYEDNIH